MSDICCIFNLGPHYRKSIFSLMDQELKCDFYLGDYAGTPIRKMDYHSLKGFKAELKFKLLPKFFRLKGSHKAVFNPNYRKYIVTGDCCCLSVWFLLIWARLTGKKVILWSHGWHYEVSWKVSAFLRMFYALSHHVLLYGDYSRNFMIRKGISPSKLSCIYNSLDYDKQLLVRKRLSITNIYKEYFDNSDPVLLYIGRIQKRKRLDLIFKAMRLLSDRGISLNFVCIGDQAEDIGINNYINAYRLEGKVWLYGSLYDESKKGELLYNATICVSPGNVGLTAMDALMFGLPIITNDDFATQMPEYEAIEEFKTGLFFKKDDVDDLAEKIEQWLNYQQNKERSLIAKECYKIMDDKYNPHYQIKVLREVLNLV